MIEPKKTVTSWWGEFKQFAIKGNMVDLAVGVVIGAAFGKVVTSLVGDVIMPPLGYLMGGVDFSDKMITIKSAVLDKSGATVHPAVLLKYGTFINNIIDFLIVAFSIFLVVKIISMAKHTSLAPATKDCPMCLSTIPIGAKRCAHCCADIGA
jgi:large conductance mechanosensitive channel